ncbi:MAG TPA: DUF4383 domain-containing protein [Bryobacteraceae bacterium]|nr:DUF4383 domain-containing protein [Bryobacteraceae bacterium]
MARPIRKIQKCAWGYAAIFLGVYLMDYVPGAMDPATGKMFGLFSMTPIVDIGHLVLGALALISGFLSARAARIYFYFLGVAYGIDVVTYVFSHLHTISPMTNFLVNLPHTVIFISAFLVAAKVDRDETPTRDAASVTA